MYNRNLIFWIILLLITGITFSACGLINPGAAEIEETADPLAMANPAAVYCQGLGYSLESVERDGGMDADCVFPDGQRCGQWDFLAGRCGQEMTYCERQGGAIQQFGNMGVCLFPDDSTCGEFEHFSGDCSLGDNPGQAASEEAQDEEEESAQEDVVEEEQTEVVQLQDIVSARDYLAAYFADEYGIAYADPWMDANLSSSDAPGVTKVRYVAGPLTIVLSAKASAPYAAQYDVLEATDRANGFWWLGTIASDGTITETEVVLPWKILDPQMARDAALEYLHENYAISYPADWIDEGMAPAGDFKNSVRFSTGSWLVVVEFEPAAPMVATYSVVIENSSLGLRWEGQVSGKGEIIQVSLSQ